VLVNGPIDGGGVEIAAPGVENGCKHRLNHAEIDTKIAGDEMTPARGYSSQKDNYAKRLRRIEGQVRGIAKMIEDDKYCIDVLTQISAANNALRSVALNLLDEHLGHCVSRAVAEGGTDADEKLAEASAAIARLVRS